MSELVIRPFREIPEYHACMALQREIWGEHFSDLAPMSILKVAQELSGVASGAFQDGELVGFVFGMTGIRDGRITHWSDMLGVAPAHRGTGLGRRLKLHQRDLLLDRGVDRMLWTFDPLMARNAYLNLTVLGATARTYLRDAYGESDSPLHAGLGTDRLLAEWELTDERVLERLGPSRHTPAPPTAPFIDPPDRSGPLPRPGPGVTTGVLDAPELTVAIPADIMAVREADPGLAKEWRLSVRAALERAFEAGYVALESGRLDDEIAAYTLVRGF